MPPLKCIQKFNCLCDGTFEEVINGLILLRAELLTLEWLSLAISAALSPSFFCLSSCDVFHHRMK